MSSSKPDLSLSRFHAMLKRLKGLFRSFASSCKNSAGRSVHNPACDGVTSLNVLEAFPAFVAHGWGLYDIRAELTLKSINQTIAGLEKLCLHGDSLQVSMQSINAFRAASESESRAKYLQRLFVSHGSDKGNPHNYHLAYQRIIENPDGIEKVFEIGLGTNNVDVVSTMGTDGKPGASLRAFKDYCPNAIIFGADFDRRVLFAEERIYTFFVDQTDPESFLPLGREIGDNFDLMIDDGLHAPNANLHSLNFFLSRLKIGGWAVIEDITPASEAVWRLVASILPHRFQCHLIEASTSLLFLVQRLE